MGKQLRYLEIAQVIKTKIEQGIFPQGHNLPSQKELSEIFSTSIMTIRGALSVLNEEGIITIVHGVGTFVAAPEVHTDSIGLQGFQNEMDRQKMKIQNKIVSVTHNLDSPKLKRIFKHQTSSYSCLVRLRTIDSVPVIFQRSYVESGFSHVLDEYTEETSLYQFFASKTGTLVTTGREIITPILLGQTELEQLKLDSPCPAFLSTRISISLQNKVVLYDEAYLPGTYVLLAATRKGRQNSSKFIIHKSGITDAADSINDTELWGDIG